MIWKNKIFRKLFVLTLITTIYGGIMFTFKPFSIVWIVSIIIETIAITLFYNYIQMQLYIAYEKGGVKE